MTLFDAIFQTFDAAPVRPVCVLPLPKEKPAPTEKPKPRASIYEIDVERNHFGFHLEKKSERDGAVNWLTAYDRQVLSERDLWGGQKVQAQNATAKGLWHDGDSVDEIAKRLRLSASWVEKRVAAFSFALSEEKGG